jgi:hypothetical protein
MQSNLPSLTHNMMMFSHVTIISNFETVTLESHFDLDISKESLFLGHY